MTDDYDTDEMDQDELDDYSRAMNPEDDYDFDDLEAYPRRGELIAKTGLLKEGLQKK